MPFLSAPYAPDAAWAGEARSRASRWPSVGRVRGAAQDWEAFITTIVDDIIKEQSPAQLCKVPAASCILIRTVTRTRSRAVLRASPSAARWREDSPRCALCSRTAP